MGILCSENDTKYVSCVGELENNELNMSGGMEFQGYDIVSDDVPYHHDTETNSTSNTSYGSSALISGKTNISQDTEDLNILFDPTSLIANVSYANEYTSLPGNETKTVYIKLTFLIKIL